MTKIIFQTKKRICFKSYNEFISDPKFSDYEGSDFHVGLVPVPFHGSLESADIFIGLINPGFKILDYYVEENQAYRSLLLRNLKQDLKTEEYPFIPLDPKWHWTSGGKWWNDLFIKIIGELREKGLTNSYSDAAKFISKRIAALEFIPYHSVDSGNAQKLAKKLKSSELVKDYVKRQVLPKAANGQALLVIVSGLRMWDIKEGCKNVIYPSTKKSPKAYFSMKEDGAGTAILNWLTKSQG